MVILAATLGEVRDLVRWRPSHDRRAGTRRCLRHVALDLRARPLGCPRCVEDLHDWMVDMLHVAGQINPYLKSVRKLLATAQDAGRA